jgi:death-on-curing protein
MASGIWGFLNPPCPGPVQHSGTELYPTSFHKAAALMESLVKNHPFIDGNKRTAIISAAIFLQMNGYLLKASHNELVDFAVLVAAGQADFNYEVAWFKKNTQSR